MGEWGGMRGEEEERKGGRDRRMENEDEE